MPLTLEKKQLITEIDREVTQVISEQGDDVEVLVAFVGNLPDTMQSAFEIVHSISRTELSEYCFEYPGFFRFLRIMDKILERLVTGEISIQEVQERIERLKHSTNVVNFPENPNQTR